MQCPSEAIDIVRTPYNIPTGLILQLLLCKKSDNTLIPQRLHLTAKNDDSGDEGGRGGLDQLPDRQVAQGHDQETHHRTHLESRESREEGGGAGVVNGGSDTTQE